LQNQKQYEEKPSAHKKENPFGSATPREEVLARKGIDFHVIDDRIQKKSCVAHFSRDQEFQLRKLQDDLEMAEEKWRVANEKELPEEQWRLLVEKKRRALNDRMEQYKEENKGRYVEDERRRFERPSERRRRRYDKHRNDEGYYQSKGGYYEDSYSSFHRKDRWYNGDR
jgi:hypothetical protein